MRKFIPFFVVAAMLAIVVDADAFGRRRGGRCHTRHSCDSCTEVVTTPQVIPAPVLVPVPQLVPAGSSIPTKKVPSATQESPNQVMIGGQLYIQVSPGTYRLQSDVQADLQRKIDQNK